MQGFVRHCPETIYLWQRSLWSDASPTALDTCATMLGGNYEQSALVPKYVISGL